MDFGVMLEVPANWSCIAAGASNLDKEVDWVAIFPKSILFVVFYGENMQKEFDAEPHYRGFSKYDFQPEQEYVELVSVEINGVKSDLLYENLIDAVQSEIDAAGNGRFSFSFGVEFKEV